MLSLAADAIFAKAKDGSGGAKVQKASLPTDNLVTLLTVGTPILLITFALTFSPNLATEDGMRCAPTAPGIQNRFYIYNYCWENFVHYELDANGTVVDERDMIHHKAFPYVFFCGAFIMALPAVWWMLYESERVKRQATYMMSGLEEGLSMTIAVTADMVMDTKEKDKTEDNVNERMDEKLRSKYKDEIEIKFESFKSFLQRKGAKTDLARAFLLRRFMTIILMIFTGLLMYKVYYEDDQDYFNCKLNWKAKNALGTYGPTGAHSDGTDYILCSIGDISTRHLLIEIYLAILVLCVLVVFGATVKECIRAKDAFQLIQMIPMISEDEIEEDMNKSSSFFGVRDIHILLYLAKENFGDHKIFQMCSQALELSNYAMGNDVGNLDKEEERKQRAQKYESFLETMVAWGIEDESDDTTQTVIGNVYKTEQ